MQSIAIIVKALKQFKKLGGLIANTHKSVIFYAVVKKYSIVFFWIINGFGGWPARSEDLVTI